MIQRRTWLWLAATAIMAAMGAGCASQQKAETPAQSQGKHAALNAWLAAKDQDIPTGVYRVAPPDKLKIVAPNIKELDGAGGVIRSDGKLSLNLLGDVYVAGKTPAEISEDLCRRASKYYQKEALDISVQVVEFKSRVIYVMGQFVQPGIKPYTGRDTIVRVVAAAKLNELAWPEKVIIVRPNDDPNMRQRVTVDMKSMFETGDMAQDFLIEEGDVVYVPPSPLAQFNLTFSKLLFPVRPVTTLVFMGMGL